MADRMDAVLARMRAKVNGGGGDVVRDVPAEPCLAPTPAVLAWKHPERHSPKLYVLMSVCEKYSVHAVKYADKWEYAAFRRSREWNNVLYPSPSSKEDALKLCQEHARANP
jgi:hypothetical protein